MDGCPSLEQLQRLLDEALETETYHAVAHHLEECPSCRDVLDALTDSAVGVWPPANASNKAEVTQAQSHGLYRPIRLHARGGLGEVFEVRDEQFQRPVALKVLHERAGADPERRRRFLQEARITAQLEHPGIPPVHTLTQTDDGRPGYTMRFLQGETLHEAVRKSHEANPSRRRLTPRQLLSHFLAVCNTVAYAHSRGLVHGDLKPGNIMLGPFGETLVLDWGLARRVGEPEETPSAGRETTPDEFAADAPGAVVSQVSGTPGFMSPEQAAGRGARVGPASDVYSLGATLYFLLTGQPPFPAPRDRREWQAIAARIRQGDFPRPRLVNRRVPAALEAVCLKAMALRPPDRYAGVLALAADLEHWLAGEPVSACPEPWRDRAARWLKKHRVLTAAAAVGVLIALISLATATALLRAAYGREQQAHDAAEAQRAKADAAYGREQQARTAAETQRAKADAHLDNALKAVAFYLRQIHEVPNPHIALQKGGSLPSLSDQKALRASQAADLAQLYQRLQAEPDDQDPRFVQLTSYVLHGLGICHSLLGHQAEGEKYYLQALALQERLLTESPEPNAYAFDLADTACDLARRYRGWSQPDNVRRLFQRIDRVFHSLEGRPAVAANLATQMAKHLRQFGPPEEGIAWLGKAITLLETAHRREPANTFITAPLQTALLTRALCCTELAQHAQAVRDWDRLLALGVALPAELRAYRAISLAMVRDHVRATAEADAVAASAEISGETLYHLAATYAESVAAVRQDAKLSRQETERRAEQYATRALALLARARTAGFFQTPAARANFIKESNFDPLRSRADFRQFVTALNGRTQGGDSAAREP